MLTFILLSCSVASFEFKDAFKYANGSEGSPNWFSNGVSWEVRDEVLLCEGGGRSMAILEKAPHGREVSVEAVLSVNGKQGTEWAVAGVGVRKDDRNFWHFALVEAPQGSGATHHVELVQMLDGAWLSQDAPGTQLPCLGREGDAFGWQIHRPYRLRVAMSPGRIEGTLTEMDGTLRAKIAYALKPGAVESGQPMLDCGGFLAQFDDVRANVDQVVPAPKDEVVQFPKYSVPGFAQIQAEATGFFYPKEIDGRWWMIDPNGQGFYMVGTDHASYGVHWCQKLGYAPYAKNMQQKYGSEKAWADVVAEQLAAWRFNTLPANHSNELRYRRFPHIQFLSFGTAFSDIDDICPKTTWTGFPNVFSPKWPRHCDKFAKQACASVKDDPWLIGYFLDNELEWFGKSGASWGLFAEAWRKPVGHSAKQTWIAFIKEQMGKTGIKQFNADWGTSASSFEDLENDTSPRAPKTDRGKDLATEWVRKVAVEYFRVCSEAIRKHDPHHLILGCRFAGDAPDIWDIAGRYCDVVSFNMYPRIDVERGVPLSVVKQIEAWHDRAQRPMMITEWSFPALDAGLPSQHGAGMRVDTQAQRAKCFTHFQTLMFSLPFMVGSDYFMWVDEPALGISDTFPEDSNYGLVNEKGEPYSELTQAATWLNAQVSNLHSKADPKACDPGRLAPWFSDVAKASESAPQGLADITSGRMRLKGWEGGRAWQVEFESLLLGEFRAMVHQETSQSLWVDSDATKLVAVRRTPQALIVDMELSRQEGGAVVTKANMETSGAEAQQERPRRFNSGWRFWVSPNEEWFASQCLWIENADTDSWRVQDMFHHLVPMIGGDPRNDEPLKGKVPNYYQRGAAWIDTAAQRGVGCWYANEEDFQCSYWDDPAGYHHSDLMQHVDRELAPGERLDLKGSPAFFFPLDEASTPVFGSRVSAIEKDVMVSTHP